MKEDTSDNFASNFDESECEEQGTKKEWKSTEYWENDYFRNSGFYKNYIYKCQSKILFVTLNLSGVNSHFSIGGCLTRAQLNVSVHISKRLLHKEVIGLIKPFAQDFMGNRATVTEISQQQVLSHK